MTWEDRIRKQEENKLQEAKNKQARLERVLENLKIQELLKSMLDEIWKWGEVYPPYESHSDLKVQLSANWRNYKPGSIEYITNQDTETAERTTVEWINPPEVNLEIRYIIFYARYVQGKIEIEMSSNTGVDLKFDPEEPFVEQLIESALIDDIGRRRKSGELPYDVTKRKCDEQLISLGLDPSKGGDVLNKEARSKFYESQNEKKKKSWWKR